MFGRKISAETRGEAIAALYLRRAEISGHIADRLTAKLVRDYWKSRLVRVDAAIKELETP